MSGHKMATFAGGCFWCMEPVFRLQKGVKEAVVGYVGGDVPNPTYEQVISGRTGAREGIQITFDPAVTPYDTLLKIFFFNIDPTDAGGQFYDRGEQYMTGIYYHDEEQKREAEAAIKAINDMKKFDAPVATDVLPYVSFAPAEDYHQGYYKKNPLRYEAYHIGSGREDFKRRVWGDEAEIIERGGE